MTNEIKLISFENAVYHFKKRCTTLCYSMPIVTEFNINNRRYKILEVNNKKYLTMFKRDFFMTYAKFFPEDKDLIGESVNREDLKRAIAEGCTALLYLYEDGKAYKQDIANLLNHWHLRETMAEQKDVYSFGLSNLERWEQCITTNTQQKKK
jgi:hypothetical protein